MNGARFKRKFSGRQPLSRSKGVREHAGRLISGGFSANEMFWTLFLAPNERLPRCRGS